MYICRQCRFMLEFLHLCAITKKPKNGETGQKLKQFFNGQVSKITCIMTSNYDVNTY